MTTEQRGADRRVVVAITAVIAALVVLVAVLLLTRPDDVATSTEEQLTATPISSATDTQATPGATSPTSAGSVTPSPAAEPTPSPPEPTGASEPAGETPTADQVDAFVESVTGGGPDADALTAVADVDGDGAKEILLARVVGGRSELVVGSAVAGGHEPTFTGEGGSAEAVVEVLGTDLDGDPATAEVAVRQTSGTDGESISVWGVRDGSVVPLEAVDGCWHGSHTYGIIGASLGDAQIIATCDGSPEPMVAWPSDVYTWDPALEAFAYERTLD